MIFSAATPPAHYSWPVMATGSSRSTMQRRNKDSPSRHRSSPACERSSGRRDRAIRACRILSVGQRTRAVDSVQASAFSSRRFMDSGSTH
jgi:hypothetical protein